MNQLYLYSRNLLNVIGKNSELVEFLKKISETGVGFKINPQDILNLNSNPSTDYPIIKTIKNKVKNNNDLVLQIVRSIRPNNLFEMTNKFIYDLNVFDHSFNDDNSFIKLLKEFLEVHTDVYSEKLANQIFYIVSLSQKCNQSINDIVDKAEYIVEENKNNTHELPNDYTTIRIASDQDVPLIQDFISIFNNIENLYNFICLIYKLDKDGKPLIINQVNTGSWSLEFSGINQTIVTIENLLKGIGIFIRDFITGKLSREKFENECMKAEAFISLLKIAKENGIDNAELKVFKHLNSFVENLKGDTTVIEVNDEEILKLRETDKLTLIEKGNKRKKLLKEINLKIEKGSK